MKTVARRLCPPELSRVVIYNTQMRTCSAENEKRRESEGWGQISMYLLCSDGCELCLTDTNFQRGPSCPLIHKDQFRLVFITFKERGIVHKGFGSFG